MFNAAKERATVQNKLKKLGIIKAKVFVNCDAHENYDRGVLRLYAAPFPGSKDDVGDCLFDVEFQRNKLIDTDYPGPRPSREFDYGLALYSGFYGGHLEKRIDVNDLSGVRRSLAIATALQKARFIMSGMRTELPDCELALYVDVLRSVGCPVEVVWSKAPGVANEQRKHGESLARWTELQAKRGAA